MICNKCGSELVEIGKIKEQTYYKCPNCNYQPVYNELKAQWEPEKKKMGCFAIFGMIIGFVVVLFLATMLAFGSMINGDDGLIVMSVCLTLLALGGFIFASVKKIKTLKFIAVGITVAHYLMLFGAVNNFPEFIRRIQGEDFVGLWWVYCIIVNVLALVAEIVVCLSLTKSNEEKLVNINYSDSDLMLLQDFSSYKMTGFYLLKAKLNNIIKFKVTEATEDIDSMVLVELNNEISPTELGNYCEQNPQVKRIVEFLNIRSQQQYEYTRVKDVVIEVKPEPEIQSVGGQAAVAFFDKLKKIKLIIFCIATALVYYLGITKMFMGMHNNKNIDDLFLNFLPITLILVPIFFGLSCWLFNKLKQRKIVKMIVKKKRIDLPDYEQYVQNILTQEQQATVQEQQNILRYYVTYAFKPSDYKANNNNMNMVYNILSSVFAAEALAAAKAKSRSSSGGCGGCAGGCGGGCGGCGGCGD